MKILIVEDEPSLREIMVRTLTREQYIVEQAADYAAALDKIAAYDYDCILLDIMLHLKAINTETICNIP